MTTSLQKLILSTKSNPVVHVIIIIFIGMLIFINTKLSFMFLILSLLFIIIIYYIQKKYMKEDYKEHYKENYQPPKLFTPNMNNLKQQYLKSKNFKPDYSEQLIIPGPEFISENQKLAGKANPKTLIPPIIVAPPMDLDFWRANNLVNHSNINTGSQHDEYLSGYKVSNCCDLSSTQSSQTIDKRKPVIEEFEYPYDSVNSGLVNTACGYNSNQIIDSDLPSNINVGNCELTQQMKEYNKNLFTQYIQPDIYTRNEVIEPINSNIGISFTPQFKPKTYYKNENNTTYIEHDPNTFHEKIQDRDLDSNIAEYNIYDPRFNGYGTSYRAYNDNNLGQTKFYYDDINSVKMPNYLVRSNIDFAKYADSYGPLSDENKKGNINTNNIRSMAQDSFLNSSLQQRDSLSESLMRKRNGELWQLRKYPIRTFGK